MTNSLLSIILFVGVSSKSLLLHPLIYYSTNTFPLKIFKWVYSRHYYYQNAISLASMYIGSLNPIDE